MTLMETWRSLTTQEFHQAYPRDAILQAPARGKDEARAGDRAGTASLPLIKKLPPSAAVAKVAELRPLPDLG